MAEFDLYTNPFSPLFFYIYLYIYIYIRVVNHHFTIFQFRGPINLCHIYKTGIMYASHTPTSLPSIDRELFENPYSKFETISTYAYFGILNYLYRNARPLQVCFYLSRKSRGIIVF